MSISLLKILLLLEVRGSMSLAAHTVTIVTPGYDSVTIAGVPWSFLSFHSNSVVVMSQG